MDVRRRRAGRWGKMAGMDDGDGSDEDDPDADEWESSSEDEEFAQEPSEDEFFRNDHNGYLVQGQYTTEGFFLVEVRDRGFPGRCDKQGFMLDEQGVRIQDFDMGDRVKTRAFMVPQSDESQAQDQHGMWVDGAYDKDGYFYVVVEMRQRGRTDRAGYLIDKHGRRVIDHQMKERIRKRSYPAQQPDELYIIDDDGEKVHGRYEKMGYFVVDESDRRPGLTDRDGYLIDDRGLRIASEVMRDRFRVRAQLYPQDDEFFALDANGKKVAGKYSRKGHFLVDLRDRDPSRNDEEGYLLDATGERYRNIEVKERKRQRRFLRHQQFMKPQEDEFFAYDGQGERVAGRYDANGWFLADPGERRPGRTDRDGYLLDYAGERVHSALMANRLTQRKEKRAAKSSRKALAKIPEDEKYRMVNGVRVPGKFDANGNFLVAPSHRKSVRVDAQGFLVGNDGRRTVDAKIKERIKKRELQNRNAGASPNKRSRERRQKRSASRGSLEEHVDPEQMYAYFQEQSVKMSKKAEGDRAQMHKMLEINKQIRQYDLKKIKDQEVEDMRNNIKSIKDDWAENKAFLQKQVMTLSEVKDRHDNEVEEYRRYCGNLEPASLRDKLLDGIARMEAEGERLSLPVRKLATDLDYARERRDQVRKDLERAAEENRVLRERLNLPQDAKPSPAPAVQALREEMERMRARMVELEKNSIDVGQNPGQAIERISNPLLDELHRRFETEFQPGIEEGMHRKGELERLETEINGRIYDEQMRQVTLKQESEEMSNVLEDLAIDVRYLQQRIQSVQERRVGTQERVDVLTREFVARATTHAGELDERKDEASRWRKVRDRYERLAEELQRDRFNGSYRYQPSVEDLIDRTKALDDASAECHDVLLNMDQKLNSQYMDLSDIQQIIHVGRLADTEKRDILIADIEAKAKRVREIIAQKEQFEVEMAPAGVVNFMYSNLNDVQEELRRDVMTFVQHKASMVQRLEEMLRSFKDNNVAAVDQHKDVAREAAKNRAFDCILNTKMLSNKIMSQLLKEANGGKDVAVAGRGSERFTYDADQYQNALEEKFAEEKFQKNREITRLKDEILAKDRSIQRMRDQLEEEAKAAPNAAEASPPKGAPVAGELRQQLTERTGYGQQAHAPGAHQQEAYQHQAWQDDQYQYDPAQYDPGYYDGGQ